MPQVIGSHSGRVGAKHSLREASAQPKAERRMLRPYALPGSYGPGARLSPPHKVGCTPWSTAFGEHELLMYYRFGV